jgi:hypothetical protein
MWFTGLEKLVDVAFAQIERVLQGVGRERISVESLPANRQPE